MADKIKDITLKNFVCNDCGDDTANPDKCDDCAGDCRRCPECKKAIEYAQFTALLETWGEVELDSATHDTRQFGDFSETEYYCTECKKDITKYITSIL